MIPKFTTKLAAPTPATSAGLDLTRLNGDKEDSNYVYQGADSSFVGATARLASQITRGGVQRNLVEVSLPVQATSGSQVVDTTVKCYAVLSFEPKYVTPTIAVKAYQALANALSGTPTDGSLTLAERALVYGEL